MNNDRPDRRVTQQAHFMLHRQKVYKKTTTKEINTRSGLTLCGGNSVLLLGETGADTNRWQMIRNRSWQLSRLGFGIFFCRIGILWCGVYVDLLMSRANQYWDNTKAQHKQGSRRAFCLLSSAPALPFCSFHFCCCQQV